jgi:drug/metabolite transporter (DMT)-like permease
LLNSIIFNRIFLKMKKTIFTLLSVGIIALPLLVLAQQPSPYEAPGWEELDFMAVLESIANWLWAGLLVIAAIFIIIAGYFFVTAMGDPDKVATARQFVLYALIGVLVGFLAKALVLFVDTIVRG